jgi:hypothetical protein
MDPKNQMSRIDPENRLGLDFHAARALGRKRKDGQPEFENLDPVARRDAVKNATFREGEPMRAKLLQVLDRLDGTPEQLEFLAAIEAQFAAALAVWTEKFPISTENAPQRISPARNPHNRLGDRRMNSKYQSPNQ